MWYLLATASWVGVVLKATPSNLFQWVLFVLGLVVAISIISFSHRYSHNWVPALISLLLLVFLLSGLSANFRTSNPDLISETKEFYGRATLISDPRPIGKGTSFRAKLNTDEGSRLAEVFAYGKFRYDLEDHLVGEWVMLGGSLSPPNTYYQNNYYKTQARLNVKQVGINGKGSFYTQLANGYRRSLEAGAASLNPDQKALMTGLVYGDDRNQSLIQRELFRSTGLSHILAVSGQNVAFVLMIFYPLLSRLPIFLKWLLFSLVLGLFLTITRFEPSVLRAVAMASVAFFSFSKSDWPKEDLKEKAKYHSNLFQVLRNSFKPKASLGIAVLILILISPSIVFYLGFQLSVLASAAIIFISPPLAKKFVGPRWLRYPLAITISAQLAVAPLVIFHFGKVTLGALPANIMVLPVVGAVTIWAMTGGLIAGLIGGSLATVIHFPSKILLSWIQAAAEFSANLDLGWLGYSHIFLLVVGLALLFWGKMKILSGGLICLSLAAPIISPHILPQPDMAKLSSKIFLWQKEGLLVIKDNAKSREILETLRQNTSRVSGAELLIFKNTPTPALVEALQQIYAVNHIWVPSGIYIAGTTTPFIQTYQLGKLFLVVAESKAAELSFKVCKTKPQDNCQIY